MIQTLKCPSCSAPLDYEDDTVGRSFRCPYCNNKVLVPGSDRPPQFNLPTIKIDARGASAAASRVLVAVVVVIGLGLVATGLAAYMFVGRATREVPRTPPADAPRPLSPPTRPSEPPKAPGFATVAMKFGSEGTGPGLFTDARSIAVDGEGRIYVADYTGGRVQVFDSAGKFQTQWMVDPKAALLDLAADRKGTVYVVQGGKIQRFEGATGKPLGAVEGAGSWVNDVTVTADGGLVAAARVQRDDILRLDSSGRVTKTIPAAISGQTDRSELNMKVAADGLGNVYALGTFNDAVLKFTPDGKFVNKFGSGGDQPGQFRAAQSVAVDGQGRVYVSDFRGVQVFDSEGRYLDTFRPGGIAFGMVFNDAGEMFIASRTQVLKLVINGKQ